MAGLLPWITLALAAIVFLILWALYNRAYKKGSDLPFPMTALAALLALMLLLGFLGPDYLVNDPKSKEALILAAIGPPGVFLVLVAGLIAALKASNRQSR